jgi:hypothetical protein
MSLPNGLDDHNNFDDLAYLGHEGQHQPAHQQYETRQAAATGMTPTQPNKDQEEGVAEQTGRPAKDDKMTNRAVDTDAAPATDKFMDMDFSNLLGNPVPRVHAEKEQLIQGLIHGLGSLT